MRSRGCRVPDWKHIIERKIGSQLRDTYRAEVVKELAAHMEDGQQELIAAGITRNEAFDCVFAGVGNWRELGRQVRLAKERQVNTTFKHVIIPGTIAFLVSSLAQIPLFRFSGTSAVWRFGPYGLTVNGLWLLTAAIVGAGTAYALMRAGATRRARLAATAFPSLVMAAAMLLVFPFAVAFDRHVRLWLQAVSLSMGLVSWVLLPLIASWIGVLPFLRAQQESTRQANAAASF